VLQEFLAKVPSLLAELLEELRVLLLQQLLDHQFGLELPALQVTEQHHYDQSLQIHLQPLPSKSALRPLTNASCHPIPIHTSQPSQLRLTAYL
jgi:hypothetical protein